MTAANDRIRCTALKNKIISAEEAAALIKDGMRISIPHFSIYDYPVATLEALAKQSVNQDPKPKYDIITGCGMRQDMEKLFAESGIVSKYLLFSSGEATMRKSMNTVGEIEFVDINLSEWGQNARYGFYGDIDFCLCSVSGIDEQGNLLPSIDIGNIPSILKIAKKVLIEINVQSPKDFYKLCDVYVPEDPPRRKPIPIEKVSDRIGVPYMECDPDKIAGIVITDRPIDLAGKNKKTVVPTPEMEACSDHFVEFIRNEVRCGRMPPELLPFEIGIGTITDLVLKKLGAEFPGITVYSEGLSVGGQSLLEDGTIRFASVGGLWSSPVAERIFNNPDKFADRLLVRPSEISNNPEVTRRIGLIAMNNILEADIYGNVNSTNVMGTKMMGGIGGSGDFARSAYLSVFFTLSTAKGGNISAIVPFCSHIDHTEHDTDILVTEYGVADLRYCSPRERVERIIAVAHPDYREMLRDYYERACAECGPANAHTPHMLGEAMGWYERAKSTGSMKIT